MKGNHVMYPKRMDTVLWDPIHVEYPIRKFPGNGKTSQALCHQWNLAPEVLTKPRRLSADEKQYSRNHACLADINRSESNIQFGYKQGETMRFNKHTESNENRFSHPPRRVLEDRPPMPSVHGTTEMRSSFTVPATASKLVTDKEQIRHPLTMTTVDPHFIKSLGLSVNLQTTFPPRTATIGGKVICKLPDTPRVIINCIKNLWVHPEGREPSWDPNLQPLDTTHEGFAKYLDPYLTTNRLQHRPFTADQLSRPSNAKDIVTYYTFSNEPWVRSRKPGAGNWWLPIKMPKSMYDREIFKQDRREIRVPNKLGWVPGSFRTEVQDNFINPKTRPQSSIHNKEEDTQFFYKRCSAKLATNDPIEDLVLKALYDTESHLVGSGRPVCSSVEQHKEKNVRLQKRSC